MDTDTALTITLWGARIVVFGVPTVIVLACAWILCTDRQKQIRELAGMQCPHCGKTFGRGIAVRAMKSVASNESTKADTSCDFDVGET